jgi:toxin-antitoxin system PIN domain toxin
LSVLLDANVLIALVVEDHVHHDAADEWLENRHESFATCPITEGALIRMLVRQGQPSSVAAQVVRDIAVLSRHEFWPDDISYADVALSGVIGHRQVTDAYLAQLARRRDGRVATFDEGMAALHQDVAFLVPTAGSP